MPCFLKTVHGTFLHWGNGREMLHGEYNKISPDLFVLTDIGASRLLDRDSNPLAEIFPHDHGLGLRKGDHFFSARNDTPIVGPTVTNASWWECVWMVPREVAKAASNFNLSPEIEADRFASRVQDLIELGEPVKVYCGAGGVPKSGFLNLDITPMAINFAMTNPHEYFIFPFVDRSWPLANNVVDYICHEDCIEHLSQQQQIQFLAETYRVLKPGGYHRVNTPNIIAAMLRHSDWSKGWEGTYKGELEWGHVCLFSPASLKEIAEMIGYAAVIPSLKGKGLSRYAILESRPGGDRDEVTGNVIADLRKD